MQSVHGKAFAVDKYFKDNSRVQKASLLLVDMDKR